MSGLRDRHDPDLRARRLSRCVGQRRSAVRPATSSSLRDILTAASNGRPVFAFRADQPLRYLAFVVADSRASARARSAIDNRRTRRPGVGLDRGRRRGARRSRAHGRGRRLTSQTEDILRFYASLMGERRITSATVALVESELPGGHSPGYFAVLNDPLPIATARTGATTRRRSRTSRSSSSRTNSRTSGGARRSAGRTTTSSGSAKGSRSTSPRSTRSERARRARLRRHAAAVPPLGAVGVGSGPDLSRLPARPHQERRRASSARSSTTRARPCCTCCGAWSATRRSSAGCAASTPTTVPEGRHRRLRARDGGRVRPDARALLRALDLRHRRIPRMRYHSRDRRPSEVVDALRAGRRQSSTCR